MSEEVHCPTCGGYGEVVIIDDLKVCHQCHGAGVVTRHSDDDDLNKLLAENTPKNRAIFNKALKAAIEVVKAARRGPEVYRDKE